MSEKNILNDVALYFTKIGGRIFRNNSGMAWQGKGKPFRAQMATTVRLNPGDVVLRSAQPIKYGLCVGSTDQIGWKVVHITQEMVGTKIAQFAAVESKFGKTTTTSEQKNFCRVVNEAGGFAKIIHDVSEL